MTRQHAVARDTCSFVFMANRDSRLRTRVDGRGPGGAVSRGGFIVPRFRVRVRFRLPRSASLFCLARADSLFLSRRAVDVRRKPTPLMRLSPWGHLSIAYPNILASSAHTVISSRCVSFSSASNVAYHRPTTLIAPRRARLSDVRAPSGFSRNRRTARRPAADAATLRAAGFPRWRPWTCSLFL